MTIKDLMRKIKLAGGRNTKTRQAVLDFLLSSQKPISAAEILNKLQKQKLAVNRTTIYRELNFLLKNNFINEVKLIGQPSLFELSDEHCHHLICLKCNHVRTVVMDQHLEEQEKSIAKKEKFKITGHALEFYGVCKKCQ